VQCLGRVRGLPFIACICLVPGCHSTSGAQAPGRSESHTTNVFIDATLASGLAFTHDNFRSGQYYFPEHLAPGVALFDFDNDGDLDLFVVQGQSLQGTAGPDRSEPRGAGGGRLFRNLLNDARGVTGVHFEDVTARSGIVTRGFGMGVAAADVDNDGCVDLYVTNFGPNQLFRNNCDGTFSDVSHRAGVDADGFSVSAAFVDVDRDGWLDLYVGSYVDYRVAQNPICRGMTGARDYCSPHLFRSLPDRLYRNLGNGVFLDISRRALIGAVSAPTLGVLADDFDGDGWPDIFVANDGEPNQLWMNQRGVFENRAGLTGVALNADGKAVAGMGVDAGDFDNDGDDDLFLTTLTGEADTLFVNDGSAVFEDRSASSGLATSSWAFTGWGTQWLDFDGDGWLDLLTVNGTIQARGDRDDRAYPYDQAKQLFRNLRNGSFADESSRAGAALAHSEVGRGAAFGDIDNDGRVDVVIGNDGGPLQLLLNRSSPGNHWLGLRLRGSSKMPRDMLGATVAVQTGGHVLRRRSHTDGSYASSNDPRVLVGLGTSEVLPIVTITWPDGANQLFAPSHLDDWFTVTQLDAH
jgi:enediyne biosynthesis protein E4